MREIEYLNLSTGEITSSIHKSMARVSSCKQIIGEDIKYPSECVTADSLKESLRNLDANLHYKTDIDFEYLLECIESKILSPQEVNVLQFLCKGITGWNYWIGNKASLHSIVSPSNTSRILKGLADKNAIIVTHEHRPFKNGLILKVNPVVAFKGSKYFRKAAIVRWYL